MYIEIYPRVFNSNDFNPIESLGNLYLLEGMTKILNKKLNGEFSLSDKNLVSEKMYIAQCIFFFKLQDVISYKKSCLTQFRFMFSFVG